MVSKLPWTSKVIIMLNPSALLLFKFQSSVSSLAAAYHIQPRRWYLGLVLQNLSTWIPIWPVLFCFIPVYPCPLFSVRFRKPLFGETGHTIMNLLAVSLWWSLCIPLVGVDLCGEMGAPGLCSSWKVQEMQEEVVGIWVNFPAVSESGC